MDIEAYVMENGDTRLVSEIHVVERDGGIDRRGRLGASLRGILEVDIEEHGDAFRA